MLYDYLKFCTSKLIYSVCVFSPKFPSQEFENVSGIGFIICTGNNPCRSFEIFVVFLLNRQSNFPIEGSSNQSMAVSWLDKLFVEYHQEQSA